MFKRTLLSAIAILGTTVAFGNVGSMLTMAATKPMLVDGPSNVLKITELHVNPDGSDDGYEYIEIKNTGPNEVTISDVWVVMIDNEDSEDGEVDFVLRLNQAGMPSTLTSGQVLVIRDTTGGSVLPIVPSGGTTYDFNFTDPLKNSGGSFFLVGGLTGIAYGDHLDGNEDDKLDFAMTSGSDAKEWTATYDHVWFSRGLDADPSSTDKSWENGTFFPSAGNFDNLKADKQEDWTPDGISRLKDQNSASWLQAAIYDTDKQTSGGDTYFDFVVASEYTWARAGAVGVAVGTAPITVSSIYAPIRVSQGICTGVAASSQFTVKPTSMSSARYSH